MGGVYGFNFVKGNLIYKAGEDYSTIPLERPWRGARHAIIKVVEFRKIGRKFGGRKNNQLLMWFEISTDFTGVARAVIEEGL